VDRRLRVFTGTSSIGSGRVISLLSILSYAVVPVYPAIQEAIDMIEIKTSLYFTVYSTYTGVTTSKSIPLAYFYVKPLKLPLVTARIQALPLSLIQIYASADHRLKTPVKQG
jgi:hypothetical protein